MAALNILGAIKWLYHNVILRYWQFRYRTTYLTVARLTLLVLAKEVTCPFIFLLAHVVNYFVGSESFGRFLVTIEPFFVPSTNEVLIGLMAVIILGLTTWHEYHKDHINDNYGCTLLSADEQEQLVLSPTYKKIVYHPKAEEVKKNAQHIVASLTNPIKDVNAWVNRATVQPIKAEVVRSKVNKSFAEVNLKFLNTGDTSLFNCYIEITADRDDIHFAKTNIEELFILNAMSSRRSHISVNEQDDVVTMRIDELNGGMLMKIDTFYVHVPYDCNSFNFQWRANARNYHTVGHLPVEVKALFEKEYHQSSDDNVSFEYKDLIITTS